MNVIYLHTHDTGQFNSAYGYATPTPHLKELAKDSLMFRNMYCVSPTCSPSRGALLTGMYPHANGLIGLAHRGFALYDKNKHLANCLKEVGYETVLCGVQHENGFWLLNRQGDINAQELGYQRIITTVDPKTTSGEDYLQWDVMNTKKACEFLQENHKRPFFLSLGFFSTHRSYPEIEEHEKLIYDERFIQVPPTICDSKENRVDTAKLHKSLAAFDENLGDVISCLKANNLYENTLILYTTDHGLANPFAKCVLNDQGSKVSFMMRNPKYRNTHGKVCDMLVSHLDVLPTLFEMLEFEKKQYLQGKSFVSAFCDETSELQDEIYQEINFHTSYEPSRSICSKRYRYVRFLDESWDYYNCSNCDDSPAKTILIEHLWSKKWKTKELFFDRFFDPQEKSNLIGNAQYSEVIEKYRKKMNSFLNERRDSLLRLDDFDKRYIINKNSCIHPSINTEDDLQM